jgi:hypothetical protein
MWSTPGIALRRSRTGPGEKICAVNKYKKIGIPAPAKNIYNQQPLRME